MCEKDGRLMAKKCGTTTDDTVFKIRKCDSNVKIKQFKSDLRIYYCHKSHKIGGSSGIGNNYDERRRIPARGERRPTIQTSSTTFMTVKAKEG